MDKIRRASKRNFFIGQNMIFDLEISSYAKMTYVFLCRCADDEGQSFPSYSTIASRCSFSRRTALRAIQELQTVGLLSVENRKIRKHGKLTNTSNLYVLYDSPNEGVVPHSHHPSATQSPPLVPHSHHPSATQSPRTIPIYKNPIAINTQSISQSISNEEVSDGLIDGLMDKDSTNQAEPRAEVEGPSPEGERDRYCKLIADNIFLTGLRAEYEGDALIDNLYELIVEVVTSKKPVIRIAGEDRPAVVVRSVFLKLDDNHIRYVVEALRSTTSKAVSIKAYTLTTLYNAYLTMGAHYTNRVQHDLYGDRESQRLI